eukprot:6201870-Pleurochrysis_carterae.AAC.1
MPTSTSAVEVTVAMAEQGGTVGAATSVQPTRCGAGEWPGGLINRWNLIRIFLDLMKRIQIDELAYIASRYVLAVRDRTLAALAYLYPMFSCLTNFTASLSHEVLFDNDLWREVQTDARLKEMRMIP